MIGFATLILTLVALCVVIYSFIIGFLLVMNFFFERSFEIKLSDIVENIFYFILFIILLSSVVLAGFVIFNFIKSVIFGVI